MKSFSRKNRDMLGRTDTVSLKEALLLLQQHLPPGPDRKATLSLEETLGRICAADILSPENLPPYPRSTMDGYAVMARDTFGASEKLPAYLEVSGEVSMGELPTQGTSSRRLLCYCHRRHPAARNRCRGHAGAHRMLLMTA